MNFTPNEMQLIVNLLKAHELQTQKVLEVARTSLEKIAHFSEKKLQEAELINGHAKIHNESSPTAQGAQGVA